MAPGALPVRHDQRVMDPGPNPFAFPAPQVVIDRLPRREVVRQKPPRTACAQQIQDRLNDLALGRAARATARRGIGDHRLDHGPLAVRQSLPSRRRGSLG